MTWTNCFIFLSLNVCICKLAIVTVPSWRLENWRKCFKKSGLHIAWLITVDCCYYSPLVISLMLDTMKSSLREEEGLARGHRDSMWRSQHRTWGLWPSGHHSLALLTWDGSAVHLGLQSPLSHSCKTQPWGEALSFARNWKLYSFLRYVSSSLGFCDLKCTKPFSVFGEKTEDYAVLWVVGEPPEGAGGDRKPLASSGCHPQEAGPWPKAVWTRRFIYTLSTASSS